MPLVRVDYTSNHAVVVAGMREVRAEAARLKPALEATFKGQAQAAQRASRTTVSAEQQASRARIAASEKEERARATRLRARARKQDAELRQLERKLQQEQRAIEKAEQAKTSAFERGAARREKASARELERDRARFRGRAAGVARGALRGVGIASGIAAGVGGAALRQSVLLDDFAKKLSIKGGSRISATELRRDFEQSAVNVKGAKALDVAQASAAFVGKTGNIEAARDFQRLFAEYSVAADASAEDIGSAAADLFEKFDVKSIDQMSKALAILTVQGKQGSFELADAASQFPKILAAARSSGIKVGEGVDAISTIGGFTQVARTATGSSEAAATSVNAAFTQILAAGKSLNKKYGIDVQGTDFNSLIAKIIGSVGGDNKLEKTAGLQQIFGRQGFKAIAPLLTEYNKAVAEGKDGQQAIVAKLRASSEAMGAEATIRRDLAAAQQTSTAQLTHAWESLAAAGSSQLLPMLTRLTARVASFVANTDFEPMASAIEKVVFGLEKMADYLGLFGKKGDNPAQDAKEASRQLASTQRVKQSLLDKQKSGATLTPAETAQLAGLDAQIAQQTAAVEAADAKAFSGGKTRSRDQLRKDLEAAGLSTYDAQGVVASFDNVTPGEGLSAAERRLQAPDAMTSAAALALGPLGIGAAFGLSDGNREALDIARDYGGQRAREAVDTGGKLNAEGANKTLASLAGKADQTAAGLDKLIASLEGAASRTSALAVAGGT